MMKDKNIVRNIDECENMGNENEICYEKNGKINKKRMKVVK